MQLTAAVILGERMVVRTTILKSKVTLVLGHIVLWLIFFSFPLLAYNIRIFDKDFYSKEITNDLFLVALFYINAYYFVPRFFKRKRVQVYFIIVLLSFAVIASEQIGVESIFLQNIEKRANSPVIYPLHKKKFFNDKKERDYFFSGFESQDTMSFNFPPGGFSAFYNNEHKLLGMPSFIVFSTVRKALLSCLLVVLTGGFIKVSSAWFNFEKKKEELEKEKLNAELIFLKSQINPHFLFNSLNSIYSLTNENAEKAGHAVLALSNMMRYMIYDSNTEKVSLKSELSYIKHYISLQQLRLSDDVKILFEVINSGDDMMIVPLLILPFIENAFKHGISYVEKCSLEIRISLSKNGMVNLFVKNSIMHIKPIAYSGGFGLDNVKKRLLLHYPGQYDLSINAENNLFIVNLNLQLHEHKMYDHR